MTRRATTADPKLPLGTRFCKCAECGEYFESDSTFQRHQHRGRKDGGRVRCYTAAELLARGLMQNEEGRWTSKKR
jgi:hypothetical protein